MSVWLGWLGVIDTAIPFPGIDDGDWTITAWVAFEHPLSYEGPVLSVRGSGDLFVGLEDPGYLRDAGEPRTGLRLVYRGCQVSGRVPLQPGDWHHLAVRRAEGLVSALLDGWVVASLPDAPGAIGPIGPRPLVFPVQGPPIVGTLRIGRRDPAANPGGRAAQHYGAVADVAVWSTAKSDAELQTMAFFRGPLTGTEAGLLTALPFDPPGGPPAPPRLGGEWIARGEWRPIAARPLNGFGMWAGNASGAFPPPGRRLQVPFPAGDPWNVTHYINTGSHNGGSSFCWDISHAGTGRFDDPYPLGSLGAPVRAGAEEVVERTFGPGDHNSGVLTNRRDGLVGAYLHCVPAPGVTPTSPATPEIVLAPPLPTVPAMPATTATSLLPGDPIATLVRHPNGTHLHLSVYDLPEPGTAPVRPPGLPWRPFVTVPVAMRDYLEPSGVASPPLRYVRAGVPRPGAVIRATSIRRGPGADLAVNGLVLRDLFVAAFGPYWFPVIPTISFTVTSAVPGAVRVTIEVEVQARPTGPWEGLHVLVAPGAAGARTAWSDVQVAPGAAQTIAWAGLTESGVDLGQVAGPTRVLITARRGEVVAHAEAVTSLTWHGSAVDGVTRSPIGGGNTRIVAIGGPSIGPLRWRLTLLQALAQLDAGRTFAVSLPGVPPAPIEAAVAPSGRRFLRTVADGNDLNNLSTLGSLPP